MAPESSSTAKDTKSKFARELKLTRSFRSPAHEAAIAVVRTASCIRNGLLRITRKEGISLSQFNILRILRGAGGPLPTMDIANRMVEVEPGVTRLLAKLERKKLVRRERSESDARSVLCSITHEGLYVLTRLDRRVAEFEESYFASLSEQEIRALIGSLADVCISRTD